MTGYLATARLMFHVVAPFGRRRLVRVMLVVILQSVLQAIAVFSIYPFLLLITDPVRLSQNPLGQALLDVLPASTTGQLVVMGLIVVGLLLASTLVRLAAERARSQYSYGFSHWIQLRLLERALSQPYEFHTRTNSAGLIKVINDDVTKVSKELLLPLLETVSMALSATLITAILLALNPFATLAVAGTLFVFYLVLYRLLRTRRATMAIEWDVAARATHHELQQTLGNTKTIYVFGRQREFVERFAIPARELAGHRAHHLVLTEIPRGFAEPILIAAVVAVVAVATARGADATSLVPFLGTMTLAGFRLIPQAQHLYANATNVAAARPQLDAIVEVLALPSPPPPAAPDAGAAAPWHWPGTLELADISYCHDPGQPNVLDAVNLTIRRGQLVAILGTSGAGKSTLLDVIIGLRTPQSGRILVDGAPVEQVQQQWQSRLAYVPQDVILLDDTITANIAFGDPPDGIDHRVIHWAAAQAQVLEVIESDLPKGFDTVVGERGIRLSGGQRQRIGLARALYRRPELLLLDEATNQLDLPNETAFLRTVAGLRDQMAIVQVTHRLNPAITYDAVYELVGGRLRAITGSEH